MPTIDEELARVKAVKLDDIKDLYSSQISAQIGEVAVVGNLTYLEVQSIERYQKDIQDNPFTAEDEKTLDELGI